MVIFYYNEVAINCLSAEKNLHVYRLVVDGEVLASSIIAVNLAGIFLAVDESCKIEDGLHAYIIWLFCS